MNGQKTMKLAGNAGHCGYLTSGLASASYISPNTLEAQSDRNPLLSMVAWPLLENTSGLADSALPLATPLILAPLQLALDKLIDTWQLWPSSRDSVLCM